MTTPWAVAAAATGAVLVAVQQTIARVVLPAWRLARRRARSETQEEIRLNIEWLARLREESD